MVRSFAVLQEISNYYCKCGLNCPESEEGFPHIWT